MILTEDIYKILLDLRIDYAFKITFTKPENKPALISLLNSIFEHKGIGRAITDLTISNPTIERECAEDKLSTLDIMATLSDYSKVLIEMHLYGPNEFKYKSVRNWAKIYGSELQAGDNFSDIRPVICISFIDFPIKDYQQNSINKVHTLFQIMERDTYETLITDMEIHFINMKQFVKENPNRDNLPDLFSKWLSVITHDKATDKHFLKRICEDEIYFQQLADRRAKRVELEKLQAVERAERAERAEQEKLQAVERAERAEQEKLRAIERAEQEKEGTIRSVISKAVKGLNNNNHSVEQIAKILSITKEAVMGYLNEQG